MIVCTNSSKPYSYLVKKTLPLFSSSTWMWDMRAWDTPARCIHVCHWLFALLSGEFGGLLSPSGKGSADCSLHLLTLTLHYSPPHISPPPLSTSTTPHWTACVKPVILLHNFSTSWWVCFSHRNKIEILTKAYIPSQDTLFLVYYTITILSLYRFSVGRVWSVVTDRDDRPTLQIQALLALGAMSKRVRPSNHGLATQIVADLHHLLEQHTGEYIHYMLLCSWF